tara:strand:- start:163 stop:387 length:225 start_codon:yes stop_codon:yes gene_type:complete
MQHLLKTKNGIIMMSIIWGFGIACLFRKVCTGRNCIVYKAPDPNFIKNNIFSFDNKCYVYAPQTTMCDNKPIEN